MASIKKIEGVNGVSYKITFFCGRRADGKKINLYRTWTPEPGMSERKAQKELQRYIVDFENKIRDGWLLDNSQRFEEYAEYVLGLKEQGGLKRRTLENYRDMLQRLINPEIGYLKLCDIHPQTLNQLYAKLLTRPIRGGSRSATATPKLKKVFSAKKISIAELARRADLGETTIADSMKGKKVRLATADKIAQALEKRTTDLFDLDENIPTLSERTVIACHRVISVIFAQASREQLIVVNPAERAIPPKAKRKTPNYFQPEQIAAILDALETEPLKWQAIIMMFITTGCRKGEICGLKWDKVSLDLGTVKIDTALLYTGKLGTYLDTTKTEDVRYLRLPKETVDILRRYRAEQDYNREMLGSAWHESGFVFTREDGQYLHPDSISNWLNAFSKRHGLPHINAHAFRHTVASVLIGANVDVVTVSKQLGHASPATTESYYAHFLEERRALSASVIENCLLRKPAAEKNLGQKNSTSKNEVETFG